jgi:hypothetical protein
VGTHTQETTRRRAAYTAFVNSSYGQIDHPSRPLPFSLSLLPRLPAPARPRVQTFVLALLQSCCMAQTLLAIQEFPHLLASPTGHQKIQNALHHAASCRSYSNVSRTTEAMLFICNAVCIMVQIGLRVAEAANEAGAVLALKARTMAHRRDVLIMLRRSLWCWWSE